MSRGLERLFDARKIGRLVYQAVSHLLYYPEIWQVLCSSLSISTDLINRRLLAYTWCNNVGLKHDEAMSTLPPGMEADPSRSCLPLPTPPTPVSFSYRQLPPPIRIRRAQGPKKTIRRRPHDIRQAPYDFAYAPRFPILSLLRQKRQTLEDGTIPGT